MNKLFYSSNRALSISTVIDNVLYSPLGVEIKIYSGPYIESIYSDNDFKYIETITEDNKTTEIFEHKNIFIYRYIEKINDVYKTYLKVENKSNNVIKICKLSSLVLNGIFANNKDKNNSDLLVHSFRSSWCGEAKENIQTLEDLYLPIVNDRDSQTYYDFISETSYTTKTYLPVFFFEDKGEHNSVFVSLEPRGRWQVRLSYKRAEYSLDNTLCLQAFTGSNSNCDFYVNLSKGESYETFVSVFGEAKSISECMRNLNSYKRSLRDKPQNLLVFNDYMNCLWAKPTSGNTIPLINKVSELGIDVYCMDSGWYKATNEEDWFGNLGDWNENDDLFIGFGLKGIIDYAKSKNLKFGIWFELEVCTTNAKLASKPESWFLHGDGMRIYECGRYFLDIRNPEVRDYLLNKVYYFYRMGIRYIKNDYNACFFGCDSERGGKIFGLEEYQMSLAILYKEIKNKCKGLIIENCSSGAMRSDEFILQNAEIQSFSDSENYKKYPAIIHGQLMNILPEQLGIWTVIYPAKIYDKYNSFPSNEYTKSKEDANETIFSLVSGFMGCMYLGGRLDKADKKNFSLVKEAVSLYRKYFNLISTSSPIFEDDGFNYFTKEGIVAQEISNGKKSLLALWHLEGGENTYVVNSKHVKVVFPTDDFNTIKVIKNNNGLTTIYFDKNYQAILLEIEKL